MTRSMLEGSTELAAGFGFDAHGGDLDAARRAFPMAPEPWLDLSTGINPHAYPVPPLPVEIFARLPEPAALLSLERAARRAFCAPQACDVVAAPGTQALIGLLPLLRPARRVGVLGFTYSEHARTWRATGADVFVVEDLPPLETMDVAVVVNPNNPDGRLVLPCDLLALAEKLARKGGLLVVDEAFVDFCDPSASLVPVLPETSTCVLRSFGKCFGLAGVRLGFAITSADLARRLRSALGPWPVSGAAVTIGTLALADEGWRASVATRLRAEAAALDRMLAAAGFSAAGGTPLFRLVDHARALGHWQRLARAGILARRFDERPTRLRFGIPGSDSALARLEAALGAS